METDFRFLVDYIYVMGTLHITEHVKVDKMTKKLRRFRDHLR